MASQTNPVKITWHFPIDEADMGKIRPDVGNQRIRLMFETAGKADAFYQKFPVLVAEFSLESFAVARGDERGSELTVSIGQRSLFSALNALHDTMKANPAANVSSHYKFTLIE